MKKNDQIVAELNQSVPRVRRFCYDIEAEDVVTFPRLTRSDKPDFHIQLEDNQEVTLPLTSTPTHSSDCPFQVPLPPLKPHNSFNSEQSLENSLQKSGDVQKQLDFWQLVDEDHDQSLAVQITETIPEEPEEEVAPQGIQLEGVDHYGQDLQQALQQPVIVIPPLVDNQPHVQVVVMPF